MEFAMSLGTKVYPVRLAESLMMEVTATIARRNYWTRRLPWSLSDFIRVALLEKVKKMGRSRRRARRTHSTLENEVATS
jgi:hypothetical protein